MASTEFERELTVSAEPATCWKILTDVPTLVDWVSIVDDVRELAPLQRYAAVLADRVGPFKLKADLDILVSDVEAPSRIRVQAAGEDRQVSSRIAIDATLVLHPIEAGGTRVAVRGSYEVVGRVASMGAGMIRQKASKILDEFFARADAEFGAI